VKHRFRDGAMIAAAVLLALAACGMYHLGLGWFIFFMISGAVAQAIARGTNRNQNAWFAAGVLFVGFVLVVALLPKLPDPAPDGMTAEKCPRCNAEQNVPENAPSFTCWRCRYEARLIGIPGMPAAVTAVIPATSKPDRQADNLKAGTGALLNQEQQSELVKMFA
jgi:hypothetical protein